jgi:beta-lysine 5,6-aminomutase alpha subunit
MSAVLESERRCSSAGGETQRGKLGLDAETVRRCRRHAGEVAEAVLAFARRRSTASIERRLLRLWGMAGADDNGVPHVNSVIERLAHAGLLHDGIALHVGALAIRHSMSLDQVLEAVVKRRFPFVAVNDRDVDAARRFIAGQTQRCWNTLKERIQSRARMRQALEEKKDSLAYVLTATGDVFEDVRHAEAVAQHGGDIVAVIRSTAQSLLDYVPYGPTREGYGGTYATQENFRIMRAALDAWSGANRRYVRLSSFASGLCMPEISAMAAMEGLDNLVNDALYGILYRDINMERTLIDQAFSRAICAAAGIVINTGEDNYLRTADAVEGAGAVVVSQFINFEAALRCGLGPEQIGVGSAFEVAPEVENGFLVEWAHALLTRELFPDCPVKYMPPTRFMDGNVFRTHACDTLFNLLTVATKQRIQTIGVPTEGIFTPHIHDRVLALQSVNYVKTFAKDLYDELEFAEDGRIKGQARATLRRAEEMLLKVGNMPNGLFDAIEGGAFGDVRRRRDEGKGRDGVFERGADYVNPFERVFANEGVVERVTEEVAEKTAGSR